MVDALVGEQGIWWVSVEGEREPPVLDAVRPDEVTFASPFLWRPRDVIELSIAPLGQGCQIHLRQMSDDPFVPLEAAALRHRWGEHIDRDLRDRFDCGGRPTQYEVSLYRGDVDDWTIIDRVLDRSWQAVDRVPIELRSVGLSWPHLPVGGALRPEDVVWAGEFGRHRTSVGCLLEASFELGKEIADGFEIFVPLPEFGRRLWPA
jgi:hypothetical protein